MSRKEPVVPTNCDLFTYILDLCIFLYFFESFYSNLHMRAQSDCIRDRMQADLIVNCIETICVFHISKFPSNLYFLIVDTYQIIKYSLMNSIHKF